MEERVLTKREFVEMAMKDIAKKKEIERGKKDATAHMFSNYQKINNRMGKYKRRYKSYD